jgi:hypothetical protein
MKMCFSPFPLREGGWGVRFGHHAAASDKPNPPGPPSLRGKGGGRQWAAIGAILLSLPSPPPQHP